MIAGEYYIDDDGNLVLKNTTNELFGTLEIDTPAEFARKQGITVSRVKYFLKHKPKEIGAFRFGGQAYLVTTIAEKWFHDNPPVKEGSTSHGTGLTHLAGRLHLWPYQVIRYRDKGAFPSAYQTENGGWVYPDTCDEEFRRWKQNKEKEHTNTDSRT